MCFFDNAGHKSKTFQAKLNRYANPKQHLHFFSDFLLFEIDNIQNKNYKCGNYLIIKNYFQLQTLTSYLVDSIKNVLHFGSYRAQGLKIA